MDSSETFYILYLDDFHAGDVLFLQSLSRSLARRAWTPAPILLHGSGEHAERLLESRGLFRSRSGGVLQIESAREHALVEQALRALNQKLVGMLTDAVVSSVGVIGAQRNVFTIRDGAFEPSGVSYVAGVARKGVVPVVAASARDSGSRATGELPLAQAALTLASGLRAEGLQVQVVFFTTTNLPGIMRDGTPSERVSPLAPVLRESAADPDAIARVVEEGVRVLLTNSNRVAEEGGPVGTQIRFEAST